MGKVSNTGMHILGLKKNWLLPVYGPVCRLSLQIVLLTALVACNKGQTANSSQQPKQMRLAVGQIKEVSLRLPKDSTFQLVGSSENNEIVDVSPEKLPTAQSATSKARKAIFLIKGVTPGMAKVVFSQKTADQEGTGQIDKIYQVEVVNK